MLKVFFLIERDVFVGVFIILYDKAWKDLIEENNSFFF